MSVPVILHVDSDLELLHAAEMRAFRAVIEEAAAARDRAAVTTVPPITRRRRS
jgi:hypothetical protein